MKPQPGLVERGIGGQPQEETPPALDEAANMCASAKLHRTTVHLPSPSPSPSPTDMDTATSTELSSEPTAPSNEQVSATNSSRRSSGIRRLSGAKITELTESSLPIAAIPDGENVDIARGRGRGRGRDRELFRNIDVMPGGTGSFNSDKMSDASDIVDTSQRIVVNDVFAPQYTVRTANIDEPIAPVPIVPTPLSSGFDHPPRVQRQISSASLRAMSASTPPTIGGRRRVSASTVMPQTCAQPTAHSSGVSLPAGPPSLSISTRRMSQNGPPRSLPLHLESSPMPPMSVPSTGSVARGRAEDPPDRLPSPIAPEAIPLPPMSLPTLLQLELAGQRPSPLYIHHSHAASLPYESSAVKFERLQNFLVLPTYLERTIYFGALACLDAWLWTLTILPIRFFIALGVLAQWWGYMAWQELQWTTAYVWRGLGRMWQRERARGHSVSASGPGRPRGQSNASSASSSVPPQPVQSGSGPNVPPVHRQASSQFAPRSWHRRTKSVPSALTSFHKADLLQGLVIVCSAIALQRVDASRMYHFIRAQSAVKLYVIYNLVEVGDRLLSALGQDVFECLFSAETLSRNASGRSKILLPFGMFCLALVYNIAHTLVLFYQVITLNVAVNSYSNALLSLLMSNQFVEVKSSVFKRTEKENTFQLACADIVERFQLWIVLFIIAMRNVVEIGGLSIPSNSYSTTEDIVNKVPLHNTSILPASFTILPSWLVSVDVLSPFLIVVGSEMVVDWIKHGYINKFNNIKPQFYSRVLDILCKDYYTNAFMAPALMRRLGLPLIPLCTLFLRSSIQTYHMFLATHLPSPSTPSVDTGLAPSGGASAAEPSSPAMAASLERLDLLIRNALGRSVHGNPYSSSTAPATASPSWWWSSDDVIAAVTMVVVFFIVYLLLLVARMLLSMGLLRYARNRYASMKAREHAEAQGKIEPVSYETAGKRTGGYGKIEVGEERRRWIFYEDPEGLKKQRERVNGGGGAKTGGKTEPDLSKISRYEMVAKRIW